MQRYILITLLLLASASTFAQTPSFAGKRFSVHAGIGLNPALYNMFYNNEDYVAITTLPGIGVNVTPAFGIEYVLSKGVVAGGGMLFNKLNMPLTYFEDNREGFNEYDAHGFFGETKVKSKYWNVYLKFYRYQKNGSIAPIGRFHQLEFIKGSSTIENGDLVLTNSDYGYLFTYLSYASDYYYYEDFYMVDDISKIGYTYPVKDIYFKYAYGFETVLFDKIAATMSVQITYPLSLLRDDYYPDDAEENYVDEIQNRAYGAFGFSMNLGIGYFVF